MDETGFQPKEFTLNRKKFLIQILIAVGISVLFQFVIDPYIYDPIIRTLFGGVMESLGAIVITSLSMWFFSFSISFFIYPDNELVNSYLFCALIPLGFLVAIEFIVIHLFFDFLHIFPIVVIGFILWKKRSTIRFRNVVCSTVILIVWVLIVWLLKLNYMGVALHLGIIIIIGWSLLNAIMSYLISRLSRKSVNDS